MLIARDNYLFLLLLPDDLPGADGVPVAVLVHDEVEQLGHRVNLSRKEREKCKKVTNEQTVPTPSRPAQRLHL